MAITKTGADVLDLGKLIYKTPGQIGRAGKSIWELIQKRVIPAASGLARGIHSVGKPAAKGVAGTARFTYDKPQIALPLLASMGYGAYRLPRDVKKTIIHTDPLYDATTARGATIGKTKLPLYSHMFRDLKYKSPAAAAYYNKKNIYF